ncbi:MAG TPA: hypothetical protein VK025_09530 [Steroidobacter sp.]|jgi:hypothetical protein|nr:hypothetical protein [Steroidobacteraceae bacterium]HLS81628.1 hypothetical protein [Steroidobacter sp.]
MSVEQIRPGFLRSRSTEISIESASPELAPLLAWYGVLALLSTLPVALLYIDVFLMGNAVGEVSFIGFTQQITLLVCIVSFARLARSGAPDRAFSLLAAALFMCMFIRELDAFWDYLAKHLWKALVFAVLAPSAMLLYRNRSDVLASTARFMKSRPGVLMAVGLVIVLVYSRLIGKGELWMNVLGEPRVVKNAIEESTELLGYLFILAASLWHVRERTVQSRVLEEYSAARR